MKKILIATFLSAVLFSCKKISEKENVLQPGATAASNSSSRTISSSILQWQKCFGSAGTDDGYSIAAAAKDAVTGNSTGYFLVGTTNGNNGYVSGNHGNNDAWLVKTDLSGTFKWQLAIGGTGNDYGKGVVVTDDGGCLVAIDAYSTDGDFSTLGTQTGFVIVKVNSAGIIVWSQRYGSGVVQAMIKTSSGVAITGYISGPQFVDPQQSVWLLTLKPDPVAIQDQPYIKGPEYTYGLPNTHGETGYGITQTQSGGFAIVGATYSIVNSNPDIWVVNTDVNGTQLWTYELGGAGADIGWGITSSPDGSVIFTGQVGLNLVVVKLDASGNQSPSGWSTIYLGGQLRGIRGQAIISANDGYIVTGSTSSNKGEILNTNGGEDMIFVKVGLDGSKQTSYSFGGTGDERGKSIIPLPDANIGYMALGYTTSNNGVVSGNNGGKDFWMVKMNAP